MSGPWEKYQTNVEDGPWNKYASTPQPEDQKTLSGFGQNLAADAKANVSGLLDNISHGGFIGNALDPVRAYQFGQGLANYPKQLLQEVKHPLDSLYQRPISTTMDAATVADLATPGINKLAGMAGDSAVNMETRALGAQKRFRTTPFARGQVAQAAKTSLENKFFPLSGNPEIAEQNATSFLNKTGSDLSKLRSSVGEQPTLDAIKPAMDRLEGLRQQLTKGSTGGKWDAIHKSIDMAQSTLLGLADRGEKIDLNDIANARKQLGDALPWDRMGKATEKRVNIAVEKGLEDVFKSAGGDMKKYKQLKTSYGSTKNALKYLGNEVAGQEGNGFPSFTGMLGAIPELAAGAPGKALAELGVIELAKRRGAGIGANLLHAASGINAPFNSPLLAALLAQSVTNARNRKNGE